MDCDRDSLVTVLEFYAGIGGLHLALQRSTVQGRVLQAFDWDQNAIKVYQANHGAACKKIDISGLSAAYLASFHARLWLLSPACQPYTVLNPNSKGALDPRAKSFLHLILNVLPDLVSLKAHPTHLLVENVGGFSSDSDSGSTPSTRRIILEKLHSLGYTTAEFLLTPLQFSIPNSRLRYYLLAKMAPYTFTTYLPSGIIHRYIPREPHSGVYPSVPWIDPRSDPDVDPEALFIKSDVMEIWHYLDRADLSEGDSDSSLHPHAVPDRVLAKWGRLFDIVLPSARRTCCFTRGYTQLVERSGSIIQMNTELDTTKTFDTFLAAQAQSVDNQNSPTDKVAILHPLRLRYFTPSELLRIFHFNPPSFPQKPGLKPMDSNTKPLTKLSSPHPPTESGSDASVPNPSIPFIFPPEISTKTQYRLIGNSVNIHVVTELINFLYQEVDRKE